MTQHSDYPPKGSEIDQQVADVADYLCSRGDTFHLRKGVEERTRRVLYALASKGWSVEKAAPPADEGQTDA